MSIAKDYNKNLYKQLRIYAAWVPIANTLEVGDYGKVDKKLLGKDGVFQQHGNISEFAAVPISQDSPSVSIDFSSAGVRIIKFVGDVEVDVIPDSDVEAKIKIEFSKKNTQMIKAQMAVRQMQNIAQIARHVANLPDWDEHYYIVSATYTGTNCSILASSESGADVEISGKASELSQFDIGSLSAGFSYKKSKTIGLEILGETGVIGLKLFRVKGDGGVKMAKVMGGDPQSSSVDYTVEDDWGDELPEGE